MHQSHLKNCNGYNWIGKNLFKSFLERKGGTETLEFSFGSKLCWYFDFLAMF